MGPGQPKRYELSDAEWARLGPLLPPERGTGGRPARSHREVLNAILWVLCTGSPWRDVPERYCPWSTAWSRFRRWQEAGGRGVGARVAGAQAGAPVRRARRLDRALPRQHRRARPPARGGRQTGTGGRRKRGAPAQALGRSRGGCSTKLHLAVDRQGRPLGFVLTGGEKNEQPVLDALLRACRTPNPVGRPREVPGAVVADKAYSRRTVRRYLRRRGIRCVIPRLSTEPPARAFDRPLYRERNRVERAIGRLKQWRRIATRFDKPAARYAATPTVALIRLWLAYP